MVRPLLAALAASLLLVACGSADPTGGDRVAARGAAPAGESSARPSERLSPNGLVAARVAYTRDVSRRSAALQAAVVDLVAARERGDARAAAAAWRRADVARIALAIDAGSTVGAELAAARRGALGAGSIDAHRGTGGARSADDSRGAGTAQPTGGARPADDSRGAGTAARGGVEREAGAAGCRDCAGLARLELDANALQRTLTVARPTWAELTDRPRRLVEAALTAADPGGRRAALAAARIALAPLRPTLAPALRAAADAALRQADAAFRAASRRVAVARLGAAAEALAVVRDALTCHAGGGCAARGATIPPFAAHPPVP